MKTGTGEIGALFRSVAWILVVFGATILVPSCDEGGKVPSGVDGDPAGAPPMGGPPDPSGGGSSVPALERVGGRFDFPIFLTAPEGDPRLFLVEKGGRIRIIRDGEVVPEPYLDISDRVSRASEQGLLSIAFHPGYGSNGRFFVSITNLEGDSEILEYRVSADPDRAELEPVSTILRVPQPFQSHNGGMITFGPDGMLYLGLGDGGSAGDPFGNGQNRTTLLGSVLRIDVDGGAPYRVPGDNPFVADPTGRDEIWALGLRNPWRFSFDRQTGDLYIADVGQDNWEEINVVPGSASGVNYGWNVMEGRQCFQAGCDEIGLTLPALEYDHAEGCSVTGGYVYRGSALPDLVGAYVYSDFCAGFVRSFRWVGGEVVDERRWVSLEPAESNVVSFGMDGFGELYILTGFGTVYRVVPG